MLNHILLATNGSASSQKAEDYALYLARQCAATLTVLYVVDNRLMHYGQVDQLVTETAKQQFIDYLSESNEAESSRVLNEFSRKALDLDIPYSAISRFGAPEIEIVAEAGENAADMLIVGDAGRAEKKRRIIPSADVVTKILRKCPCPVLIVR